MSTWVRYGMKQPGQGPVGPPAPVRLTGFKRFLVNLSAFLLVVFTLTVGFAIFTAGTSPNFNYHGMIKKATWVDAQASYEISDLLHEEEYEPIIHAELGERSGDTQFQYTRVVDKILNQEIPDKVKHWFNRTGWKYEMDQTNLNDRYNMGLDNTFEQVYGLTVFDEKVIHIMDRRPAVENAVKHEMGHWLDWATNWPSTTDYWREISQEEFDGFYSFAPHIEVGDDSQQEIFADAFWQYLENPILMKEMAPKMYGYMDGLFAVNMLWTEQELKDRGVI